MLLKRAQARFFQSYGYMVFYLLNHDVTKFTSSLYSYHAIFDKAQEEQIRLRLLMK